VLRGVPALVALILFVCGQLLAQGVNSANLTLAEQRDYAWLLLISEPADTIEATALTQLDDHALAGLALPAHLDRRHHLPAFAADGLHDPSQLSLAQLVQLATAFRLRNDAPQAVYWYEQVLKQSDDPVHVYFYAQALRDSGYHASAKRVMSEYAHARYASAE